MHFHPTRANCLKSCLYSLSSNIPICWNFCLLFAVIVGQRIADLKDWRRRGHDYGGGGVGGGVWMGVCE